MKQYNVIKLSYIYTHILKGGAQRSFH